ncbi:MAG: sigma-54-dependent Fis family transcriptional regulator [Planctomycetes bacterium]|nr:sigma-54-dependent Fis family transcriptional regulator [Planctomycetota bacterium]
MKEHQASILVVDDEASVRDSLARWLQKDGFEVDTAESGAAAIECVRTHHFDAALLDIKMPGMDGLELQEHLHGLDPDLVIIMITAFASVDTAVLALKQGAFDYLTKPVDPDELSHLVRRAIEQQRLKEENVQLRDTIEELVSIDTIVGESPPMKKVLELIQHVARTEATVVVRGESGTGKELIARAIHANSQRRYFPIVPVNCGAVQENLLESELFGHEKGAFTGAHQQRKGKLEMASGGTLFLDEIGAISPSMQLDLLRVLETKEFVRVGGSRPIKVDFRVICATNENIEEAVSEGRFREDFYYRINVFTIEAPPLRDRRTDIALLARHFRDRFACQMDKRITGISSEAMAILTEYDWPGNVRELSNAIERAMVVGTPPAIRPEDLPVGTSARAMPERGDSLAAMEKRHIAAVLERTHRNVTRTAEILKVDRATVYNKIRKYHLEESARGDSAPTRPGRRRAGQGA